jgi:hypothetical protein
MNQHKWSVDNPVFEIVDDVTSDPVVTVQVTTPGGFLKFMAEVEVEGSTISVARNACAGRSRQCRGRWKSYASGHGYDGKDGVR